MYPSFQPVRFFPRLFWFPPVLLLLSSVVNRSVDCLAGWPLVTRVCHSTRSGKAQTVIHHYHHHRSPILASFKSQSRSAPVPRGGSLYCLLCTLRYVTVVRVWPPCATGKWTRKVGGVRSQRSRKRQAAKRQLNPIMLSVGRLSASVPFRERLRHSFASVRYRIVCCCCRNRLLYLPTVECHNIARSK